MIFRFDESVFGEKCKQEVKNDDEQHKINRTRDQSGLTTNEGIGKKYIYPEISIVSQCFWW